MALPLNSHPSLHGRPISPIFKHVNIHVTIAHIQKCHPLTPFFLHARDSRPLTPQRCLPQAPLKDRRKSHRRYTPRLYTYGHQIS